jgi:DNA repair protein RadC
MSYSVSLTGIKSWAEDDRPREKLLLKGKSVLSDAELLAILIGMGTRDHSAVDLAKIILHSVDNDLHKLAKLGVNDLKKIKGIGEAKAISIIAAMELGRRKRENDRPLRTFITNSKSIYEHLKPFLSDLPHEEFWIICLSRRMEILKTIHISTGGMASTLADPRIIFKHALENSSSSLVLCHNHPSGSLKASEDDCRLTKKLVEGARLLDINIIDHIIFTDNGYLSFSDQSML